MAAACKVQGRIHLVKELERAQLNVKDGGRHQKIEPVCRELVLQKEQMTGHSDRELIRPIVNCVSPGRMLNAMALTHVLLCVVTISYYYIKMVTTSWTHSKFFTTTKINLQ